MEERFYIIWYYKNSSPWNRSYMLEDPEVDPYTKDAALDAIAYYKKRHPNRVYILLEEVGRINNKVFEPCKTNAFG